MLAQSAPPAILLAIVAATSVAVLTAWLILFTKRFKRCPSNKLLVVFGQGIPGGVHVQHGGARLVWPLIQDFGFLSLEPIKAAFPEANVFTRESIRVSIKGDVVIAIGTAAPLMQAASERLLGLDEAAIAHVGEDESAAALRELAGQLTVEMIYRDRDRVGEELKHMLEERLARYGLEVVNVRLGEISDEGGVIQGIRAEEKERLDARSREDRAIMEGRKREEAEFNARREKAEAELEERHRQERNAEAQKRKSPSDVLKEDPGDALKNM